MSSLLAKDQELIDRYADFLTQPQRDIWDQMRFEGCFIVAPANEYFAQLVRPDLTVVQKVYPATLCYLHLYVSEMILGDEHEGRIYVAYEPIRHCSILRMYEASAKANGGFKPKRRRSTGRRAA